MRKHSSGSENESNIAPSSVKFTEVNSRGTLSKVSNGNITNSKAEELNDKSKSRSFPNFSIPWNKSPQPLLSRQVHVAKAATVVHSSVAISTKLSRLSVIGSDMKGPMTEKGNAGVSRQKDQNETKTSGIPKTLKIAFPDETPPKSIISLKPPLPKSLSLDRLPSLRHIYSSDSSPRASKRLSSNRLQITDTESSPKRDELSSVFRSLDGEFHK
jgi:hypothetical protein